MKKGSNIKDYSFPIDMYSLALVAHRICNLFTGQEDTLKTHISERKDVVKRTEITQENFSIPTTHYSENLANMIKSWLAPNPIDRPVLAEVALDPLFAEFITLKPYK